MITLKYQKKFTQYSYVKQAPLKKWVMIHEKISFWNLNIKENLDTGKGKLWTLWSDGFSKGSEVLH